MIRVTTVDTETGDYAEVDLKPGNYTIVCADPCYLASETHYGNGTTVLTLKGRDPGLMATRLVDVEDPQGGPDE